MCDYKDLFTAEQTQKEVKFLITKLELNKNDKILDLACGIGRHSNELAKLGFNITGIDTNNAKLNEARHSAEINNVEVKYINKDLNEFYSQNEFNKIYLLYCYFDYPENTKVLQNIFYSLKKDGLFCFNIPNKDYFSGYNKTDSLHEKNLFSIPENLKYDNFLLHTLTRKCKYKNITFEMSLNEIISIMFTDKEIIDILKRVGFRIINVFSNWEAITFSSKSPKMIFIVKK